MTLYLQMDGVDDYIKLPSMTLTRIVADVKIRRRTDVTRLLWDFRAGIGFSYIQQTTGGVDSWGSGTVKVDTVTKTNNTAAIPNDVRCIIEHTLSSGTDDGNIFSNNGAAANTNISGDIFNIKIYNGTTLQAHYDMTTGTVQDISGNGRHATLTGGTWLDDGAGGGTDVTVTGIIANASADTLAPAVSTVSSISTQLDTLVATSTADAPNPTLSLSGNTSVTTVIANITVDAVSPVLSTDSNVISPFGTSAADALPPQVGSFTNISVTAVIVSANADAINPSVNTVSNIAIDTLIADATAEALASMVGSSASVQITAAVTSVTADTLTPIITTTQGVRVDSVAAELTIDAPSPAIQTDAIISAFIANVIATSIAPGINEDAIPKYNEVIQIVLNITRKQTVALDITQRKQSELKL